MRIRLLRRKSVTLGDCSAKTGRIIKIRNEGDITYSTFAVARGYVASGIIYTPEGKVKSSRKPFFDLIVEIGRFGDGIGTCVAPLP
jgi:hypothetical protein